MKATNEGKAGTPADPAAARAAEAAGDPARAPSAPSGPLLEQLVAQIERISSLPTVALHIIQIATDPESGASDLKSAVEADPALTARVLKCVNSAAFGLRTQIQNLGQAVSYLGFNMIRDLAVTATVSSLFRRGERINTYERSGLWQHLVAVGVAARMIGSRAKIEGSEDAFLCGVLHDLGIILFDQNAHEEFRSVMESLHTSRPLVEFERRFVPWDHTELGERIGTQWRLPEAVRMAIRHHHTPEKYSGRHAAVVHSVALANHLCSLKELPSVGMNLVPLPRGSLERLGFEQSDLTVFADDLDPEMKKSQHLFDIQKGF